MKHALTASGSDFSGRCAQRRPPFRRLTAIVKATQACNLGCTYCYVFDRTQCNTMSEEVLETTVNQLGASVQPGGSLEIVWHGGEPSLVGVEFYRKAVIYENRIRDKIKLTNSFQTNAYRMTDELVGFLKEHDFSLGVSLDGPEFLHDRCRITKDGRPTFALVIASIRKLKKAEIPFGAICVITKQNKKHIKEIYDFFHAEQVPFKINPLIRAGAARQNLSYHYLTAKEYAEVLSELFELWYQDETANLRVATVEDIIKSILTEKHTGCNGSPNCQDNFLGIGPTGDVYPCGRFEGRLPYRYGTLVDRPLAEILQCDLRRKLLQRNARHFNRCQNCRWLKICRAGCMHNALEDTGDVMGIDSLCYAYKLCYARIEKVIRQTLNSAQDNIGKLQIGVEETIRQVEE